MEQMHTKEISKIKFSKDKVSTLMIFNEPDYQAVQIHFESNYLDTSISLEYEEFLHLLDAMNKFSRFYEETLNNG